MWGHFLWWWLHKFQHVKTHGNAHKKIVLLYVIFLIKKNESITYFKIQTSFSVMEWVLLHIEWSFQLLIKGTLSQAPLHVWKNNNKKAENTLFCLCVYRTNFILLYWLELPFFYTENTLYAFQASCKKPRAVLHPTLTATLFGAAKCQITISSSLVIP